MNDNRAELWRVIEADDLPGAEKVMIREPNLLSCAQGQPILAKARSVAMAELLLKLGADIDAAIKFRQP